jgi:hypothetical protein
MKSNDGYPRRNRGIRGTAASTSLSRLLHSFFFRFIILLLLFLESDENMMGAEKLRVVGVNRGIAFGSFLLVVCLCAEEGVHQVD